MNPYVTVTLILALAGLFVARFLVLRSTESKMNAVIDELAKHLSPGNENSVRREPIAMIRDLAQISIGNQGNAEEALAQLEAIRPPDITEDECGPAVFAWRMIRAGNSYDAKTGIWWKNDNKPGIMEKLERDVAELLHWKLNEQDAAAQIAFKLMSMGFKGDGNVEGVQWLCDQVREAHVCLTGRGEMSWVMTHDPRDGFKTELGQAASKLLTERDALKDEHKKVEKILHEALPTEVIWVDTLAQHVVDALKAAERRVTQLELSMNPHDIPPPETAHE
jgi:hypothetical protein